MPKFTYKNPIATDTIKNIRDPFIIRVGDEYYLTGTFPPYWNGESAGVFLYKSSDLLKWESLGCILPQQLSDGKWFRDYWWAPEIHHKNGRFYLTVNCRNEDMGVGQNPLIAVSDRIDGEYRILNPDAPLINQDLAQELNCPDIHGNDGNLFTDDDGRTYLSFCNHGGIWAYEIDLDECRLMGEPILLAAQEKTGWDTKNEAPFLFRHGGRYYCFYSSFTRSYEVGVSMADNIRGPWVKDKNNPLITPESPVIHSGHNCVFDGPDGRLWTAYHITIEGEENTHLLAYNPFDFDKDGNIIMPRVSVDEVTLSY